jgi:hypothetical protein
MRARDVGVAGADHDGARDPRALDAADRGGTAEQEFADDGLDRSVGKAQRER